MTARKRDPQSEILAAKGYLDEPESKPPASLGDWAQANKSKTPPRNGVASSSMNKALAEAEKRTETEDWAGAKPLVFVALYQGLHTHVYGVEPGELGTKERKFAACAAARMLKNEFDNDANIMAEFFRWTWKREASKHKWRIENQRPHFRITWRLMFARTLLTDWKVEKFSPRHSRKEQGT